MELSTVFDYSEQESVHLESYCCYCPFDASCRLFQIMKILVVFRADIVEGNLNRIL